MSITTYCTDADMVEVRPNILDFGVEDWENVREEAFSYINTMLIIRWYRSAATIQGIDYTVTEFDPDLLDEDQIKKTAVYKSLELAYMSLMKEGAEADGFERFSVYFGKEFIKAFDLLMGIGLKYDWDGDDDTTDEIYINAPRRLYRS